MMILYYRSKCRTAIGLGCTGVKIPKLPLGARFKSCP
jgi:hypothetical protein